MLHDDPEEAIGTLSSAIASGGHGDSELVAMLLSRSQAHFDLGHFEASRKDALVALCVAPDNPTATFRACEACVQLNEFREACAVLSAGASHANDEAVYDFFCKRARSLGAWRLPPPLDILPARGDVPADREVPRLHSPTRDQFAAYVKRHEPVVVSGFARPEALAEWSWEVLIDAARDACLPAADARSAADAKAPSGDVTITSTGCLPDYCRPESSGDDPANPLASRIELTHFEDLSLIGSRAFVPVAADDDGAVCWVSSEGCLTPLHYDLDEGLLAQVMGEKRVWLYDYKDRGALYMRGDEGRERVDARTPVGLNNWERQSFADFHGGRRLSFPKALAAQRWRADLAPGDLLYIPAGWFHEVHSRTPSFSLGWRFGLPETADSEPELRRALEAKRNSLGPTHEETLDAAKSLSRLLYRQERFEEAEPLNRGIVDALRQRHGWQSEHAMMAVSNLGLIVARRGRLDDAATLLGEALSGLRSCDAEDPRLHSIAANLAEIRHMQGRLAEAEALYREAWAMRRKALGDVHPMTKQLAKLLASGPLQPME